MKHLNQIVINSRKQELYGQLAETSIAQEGFIDGVKDFFTYKASPRNAAVVNSTAVAIHSSISSLEYVRSTGSVDVMRFIFKEDKIVNNIPAEIKNDAASFDKINEVLAQINSLLSRTRADDVGDNIEKDLEAILIRARTHLDEVEFLANYYVNFGKRGTSEYDGSHIDKKLDPDMGRSSNIGEFVFNLVVYYFDSKKADKLKKEINEAMRFDIPAYKSAAAVLAKKLEQSVKLIEDFVSLYEKHRKHDNKHVRHVLRYGHNVVGVLTYVSEAYRPFFKHMV